MDVFVGLHKLDKDGNFVPFAYYAQFDDGPVALGWLRASHRELDPAKSTEWQPVHPHTREQKIHAGRDRAARHRDLAVGHACSTAGENAAPDRAGRRPQPLSDGQVAPVYFRHKKSSVNKGRHVDPRRRAVRVLPAGAGDPAKNSPSAARNLCVRRIAFRRFGAVTLCRRCTPVCLSSPGTSYGSRDEIGTAAFAAVGRCGKPCCARQRRPARPTRRIVVDHQGVERGGDPVPAISARPSPAPLIVALHGLGQSIEACTNGCTSMPTASVTRLCRRLSRSRSGASGTTDGRSRTRSRRSTARPSTTSASSARCSTAWSSMKVADPARIYVTGMSRGGLMTYTLACALSEPHRGGGAADLRHDRSPARGLPPDASGPDDGGTPAPTTSRSGTTASSRLRDDCCRSPRRWNIGASKTAARKRRRHGCRIATNPIRRGCGCSNGRAAATTRS